MGSRSGAGTRVRSIVKLSVFSLLMVLTSSLLFTASSPLIRVSPFESEVANTYLSYLLSAFPVACLALLLTFVFAGRIRLGYLNLRRTGTLRPFFAQPQGGRWESDGWYFGLVMMAIVGTVTYFQFAPGGFAFQWSTIALVILFSAANAFTEEVIFRLPYVTMGANETGSRLYGRVMGSLVFGVQHFWGAAPNGFIGAVMAALTGYVLAKSMQETRGFFWALMIHFMLDLPIFLWMLNQAP